jgi:hypothetical protein
MNCARRRAVPAKTALSQGVIAFRVFLSELKHGRSLHSGLKAADTVKLRLNTSDVKVRLL